MHLLQTGLNFEIQCVKEEVNHYKLSYLFSSIVTRYGNKWKDKVHPQKISVKDRLIEHDK